MKSNTIITGDLVTIRQGVQISFVDKMSYMTTTKPLNGLYLGLFDDGNNTYDLFYKPCKVAIGDKIIIADLYKINHYSKGRKNEKVN